MTKISRFRLIASAAALALFFLLPCGCQSPPEEQAAAAGPAWWQSMYARLSALGHFRMEGRIGIITPEQRGSARFQLEGLERGYILTLNAPFGSSLAVVTATENLTRVSVDDKNYDGAQAEALFASITGVKVPLQSLRNILLGLPQGSVDTDVSGRITGADLAGYRISYTGSRDFGSWTLPAGVQIKGADAEVKVRTDSFTL